MSRYCLAIVSIAFLACANVRADDYLLRLETNGFRDRPMQEQQPIEQTLESMEVVARVNQPFYGNCTLGSTRFSIDGFLEQLKDGRFRVRIRYHKATDSGESVPGPNGLQIPITRTTNINTTAIVELQKTVELGKSDGINRGPHGVELKTRTISLVSLVRFDPDSRTQHNNAIHQSSGGSARFPK